RLQFTAYRTMRIPVVCKSHSFCSKDLRPDIAAGRIEHFIEVMGKEPIQAAAADELVAAAVPVDGVWRESRQAVGAGQQIVVRGGEVLVGIGPFVENLRECVLIGVVVGCAGDQDVLTTAADERAGGAAGNEQVAPTAAGVQYIVSVADQNVVEPVA